MVRRNAEGVTKAFAIPREATATAAVTFIVVKKTLLISLMLYVVHEGLLERTRDRETRTKHLGKEGRIRAST